MKKHNLKNKSDMEDPVIEAVIEQIKEDLLYGDVSAIYEMLEFLPRKNLLAYLPEEVSEQLKNFK
jgi:hypothetical protein